MPCICSVYASAAATASKVSETCGCAGAQPKGGDGAPARGTCVMPKFVALTVLVSCVNSLSKSPWLPHGYAATGTRAKPVRRNLQANAANYCALDRLQAIAWLIAKHAYGPGPAGARRGACRPSLQRNVLQLSRAQENRAVPVQHRRGTGLATQTGVPRHQAWASL